MKKSGEIPTLFPKGTVVKFRGVPCELLQDTPYYSETFKGSRCICEPFYNRQGVHIIVCPQYSAPGAKMVPKARVILKDEVSKIQYITKLLEKEESQQLSAVESLYDE